MFLNPIIFKKVILLRVESKLKKMTVNTTLGMVLATKNNQNINALFEVLLLVKIKK